MLCNYRCVRFRSVLRPSQLNESLWRSQPASNRRERAKWICLCSHRQQKEKDQVHRLAVYGSEIYRLLQSRKKTKRFGQ
jgi:hypothetical protein